MMNMGKSGATTPSLINYDDKNENGKAHNKNMMRGPYGIEHRMAPPMPMYPGMHGMHDPSLTSPHRQMYYPPMDAPGYAPRSLIPQNQYSTHRQK